MRSGGLYILVIKQRHVGAAEVETLRRSFGQLEDRRETAGGALRVDASTGELGVFGVRAFDIHSELFDQTCVQQGCDHVRAHAVGVEFDGQAEFSDFAQEIGEVWGNRGFSARDGHTAQPFSAFGQKYFGFVRGDLGDFFHGPGQLKIVAGGAPQVAASQKEHRADFTRPIAEAHRLDAPQAGPCFGRSARGLLRAACRASGDIPVKIR